MGGSDSFINVTIELSFNLVTDCTVYVCADYIMRQGHIYIGSGYKVLVA